MKEWKKTWEPKTKSNWNPKHLNLRETWSFLHQKKEAFHTGTQSLKHVLVDVKALGYLPRQVWRFSRAEFSVKVLAVNNPKPLVVEQSICQNMRRVQNDFIFPKTNSSVKMTKPLRNHHPGPWTPKLQFWKPDLNSKLVGNFKKMKFPYLNPWTYYLTNLAPCNTPNFKTNLLFQLHWCPGKGLAGVWRYHIDDLAVAEVKLPWNWDYNFQEVTWGESIEAFYYPVGLPFWISHSSCWTFAT